MNIRDSVFGLLVGAAGMALFVLALFMAMALLSRNRPAKAHHFGYQPLI